MSDLDYAFEIDGSSLLSFGRCMPDILFFYEYKRDISDYVLHLRLVDIDMGHISIRSFIIIYTQSVFFLNIYTIGS
jgi:hypothetical protein